MKVTLESTTNIAKINDGIEARVWEGTTDTGIPVVAFIPRIAVRADMPQDQFLAELRECRAPSRISEGIDLRLFVD